jgi:hypothetical protein
LTFQGESVRGASSPDILHTVPYRSAEATELCAVCREPTRRGCRRCARPLCAEHRPPRRERCQECEAGFARRITALGGRPAIVRSLFSDHRFWHRDALILIGALLLLPVSFALFLFLLALGVAAWEIVPGTWDLVRSRETRLWRSRRRAERRRFLAERPRPRQLLGAASELAR